ncbi:phage tail tape measure C-terminal domain-containing protein [Oleispirillum naphthae]|uniref:phage tail tape measure C-terminal domain-containing protein n=1 Tax=Oleispirillum naphthae TaxID=2838853 RepID=UPI0030824799
MMTERDLAIRLSLKDSEVVRRALNELGADGQKALARIEAASAPASRGLLAINTVTSSAKGEIQGYASRLGIAGEAMSALGPAGLMASVSIAAISAGLAHGVREMELADTSMRRLGSVMKATGYASGLTSKQIADMADEIEKSTMATAENVVDATSVLSTFRSVSGDAFRRATALALDMATVFGGDMRSSAMQLGKALEDPVEGLTALRRVGVSFTQAQKDMISAMVETGNVAGAQGVILDALEQQVGGASRGEDGGVTGAAKHAAEAWDDMLEEFARTTGVGSAVANALNGITESLRGLGQAEDTSAKLAEREAALAEYQTKLAELENSGRGWSPVANFARARIRDIEREVSALRKLDTAQREAEASAQRKADEGRANAERTRNAEMMSARLKTLEAERVKGVSDAAAKIKTIEDQLAKDVAAAQQRGSLAGVTQADVDKEVALLRAVAQQKIDAVQKPLLEAQKRGAEQTAKVLADLQREVGGVSDPRTAFVDQKVASLPKSATADEIADTAAWAGELYDLTERKKEDAKAEDERGRAIERSRQFLLQNADAETVYKLQIEEIDKLKANGAINDQVYALMTQDAERRKLYAATDAASGMKRALQEYQKSAADSASVVESAVKQSFSSMENALATFVTTGKLSFSNFADSVLSDMARIIARQTITAPLASGLLSLFHEGGVVGEPGAMSRAVSPLVFAGASRFHTGGLLPGEVPIIAQAGERVLTQAQQDNTAATISGLAKMAMQSGGGDLKVVSNVYNNATGTEAKTQVSRGADGSLQIDTIVETIEGRLASNIGKGRGLAPTLEGRYGLSAASGAARG